MLLGCTLKRLAFFFVKLVLLYAVLIAPWPGVRQGYAAVLRAGGDLLVSSFGADDQVEFKPAPKGRRSGEVVVILRNRRAPTRITKTGFDSFLAGYFPTAFVVALVLATPVSWSRRAKGLLWGLLLASAFVAARVALLIVQVASGDHEGALFHPSAFWTGILNELVVNPVQAPASHFVVPLFIWIAVTLRRSDINYWLPAASSAATKRVVAGKKKRPVH